MIKNQQVLFKDSVGNICDSLSGCVYETVIPFDQLTSFRQRYVLLSEKQEQGRMIVRFVHKGEPGVEWQQTVPHLEDVFLYEYRDDVQAEV
jgi:hypothetical protein